MCIHDSQSWPDCSSSRFWESTSIPIQNATVFNTSCTIHRQLNKNVGLRSHKKTTPPPCSNTGYRETYLNIFLVSVCSCMYPGLHQSSSKVNSQGQASGKSLNRGTSIMAPASAQLTLTPAQEKEDNKSPAQAGKTEIKSTGNKIYQNFSPAC